MKKQTKKRKPEVTAEPPQDVKAVSLTATITTTNRGGVNEVTYRETVAVAPSEN